MLRRNDKIVLDLVGANTYQVRNKDGVVLNSNDDYFIYFKNVNFKKSGKIDGRYLGVANQSLIDGYCKEVTYDAKDKGYKMQNGAMVQVANLVAVHNKSKTIIVIEQD